MRSIVLNQNAPVSVLFLPVNASLLEVCKPQVIIYVVHNFEKNACSHNSTISLCKRINTCHLPAIVGSMVVAKGTSQFMVEGHRTQIYHSGLACTTLPVHGGICVIFKLTPL